MVQTGHPGEAHSQTHQLKEESTESGAIPHPRQKSPPTHLHSRRLMSSLTFAPHWTSPISLDVSQEQQNVIVRVKKIIIIRTHITCWFNSGEMIKLPIENRKSSLLSLRGENVAPLIQIRVTLPDNPWTIFYN